MFVDESFYTFLPCFDRRADSRALFSRPVAGLFIIAVVNNGHTSRRREREGAAAAGAEESRGSIERPHQNRAAGTRE